jgi:hypothetical protein
MTQKLTSSRPRRARRSKPTAVATFKAPTSAQRFRLSLSRREREIVTKNLAEIGSWCAESNMALNPVVLFGEIFFIVFDGLTDAEAFKLRWF